MPTPQTVLVTRPLAEAGRTADALRSCGHRPILAPLLDIVPVAAILPEKADALVLTSRQAVHHAPPLPGALSGLPTFVIGAATAQAARAAGYRVAGDAQGDRAALVGLLVDAGVRAPLILAGQDERGDLVAECGAVGLSATRAVVYAAHLATQLPEDAHAAFMADALDWVLLFSARAAAALVALAPHRRVQLACLSPVVAAAAGSGWADVVVAERPDLPALLAAADLMCDNTREFLSSTGEP
jgi:uroporphyrinogen-III synthase